MADVGKRTAHNLLLIAGLLCFAAGSAEAKQLNWYKDFQQAAEEANRSNRPMLVKFSADWCGYCHKMKKSFSDAKVTNHVQSCFVPVMIDADDQPQLMERIGVEGLPTTVIISPEFKVIKRIKGYRTPSQLTHELGAICQADHGALPHRGPVAHVIPAAQARAECAFGSHCLVTLLEEQSLVEGLERYSSVFRGKKVCFASAELKQRFEREPGRYWPVLDGQCIVQAVEQGEPRPGQPEWGAVFRGRLWFFTDAEHRQRFADGPNDYLRR